MTAAMEWGQEPDDGRRTLPAAVIALADRLGARANSGATVALSQTGRIRTSADARWQSFKAVQSISLTHCAFDWRARSGPLGIIRIQDALIDGVGRLDVRALGLVRLARVAPSDALTRGELIRYLAEIALAPDALLRNPAIRWRDEGGGRLIAAAGSGATSAEVVLTLDGEGRIGEAFVPDRGALVDGVTVPKPWRGVFSDYRHHNGVWLPFYGEVSWGGPDGEWVYWQGDMKTWSRRG
ncbi:hypothetical protein HZ989_04830 [Brevundimonas sp. AJA228-03]|uniref:DUF6544 family protein n=1 Tax=Brevundimonas sp. AJA228-03 TaxID=2752515 RepID=UPI001ADF0B76|nr:DUF6544 family protein [Brevundimonas sp. AJA228-03]QTN20393.1 hypothetical protein HZ989_04830 [Brevundimonas sp. AJA228-03]